MIAAIPSAVLIGVDGAPVSVEVHVSNGLPGFTVVGLPDAAVRESRDRVRAALLSSGLTWPQRRVTVNLAPSGVRKSGAGLDLPIAVGVLVASGTLDPEAVRGLAFVGELGLDGSLRGVPGTVVLAEALAGHGLVVPTESAVGALLGGQADARLAPTLRALVDRLEGRRPWTRADQCSAAVSEGGPDQAAAGSVTAHPRSADLVEVRGQIVARKALEVAAAGGHHLLMVGPPGSGKTLLATCLPGLLPDLGPDTALEVTRVHSVAGAHPPGGLMVRPPFRAPHHGATAVAMVGGGTAGMRPGELSLAHGGVLFLDEMGEFPAPVLDALRQPLEDGEVRVTRARGSAMFPARFILVGAMNPCPCGLGGRPGSCRCSIGARQRYGRRLSGPLLDRFDIAVAVQPPGPEELLGPRPSESTADVAARVQAARQLAGSRGVRVNAELDPEALDTVAPLDSKARKLLERHLRSGALTARGLHRVRRLARTVADLAGDGEIVEEGHVHEALVLRSRRDLLLGEVRP